MRLENQTAEDLYRGNEGWEDFDKGNMWIEAMEFAKKKHEGQVRDDGKPYFEHIKGVVSILISEGNESRDLVLTEAALHDVLEDTSTTYEELVNNFGSDIAGCVQLLTHDPSKESFAEYANRVFNSDEYPEARKIKIADRLHNLRDLPNSGDVEKIKRKVEETEKCILIYENQSPRKLMRLVREEVDSLKATYITPQATPSNGLDDSFDGR